METMYAVITGASNGLGKAFAKELAGRGINLILVALPGENLPELAMELRKEKIEVLYFETDLTKFDNVLSFTNWVNLNYKVWMLINNAGIGGTQRYIDADRNYLNNIIQLNVMSMSLITRELLPNLMECKAAYILNVSSMAAFSPMGYKTVYPASKAFVHHFTRGLYQELKHSGVFVSVVNPGPMKTNKEVTARINKQGRFAKIGMLTPEKVAQISIRKLFKKDSMIVLGLGNGLSWLLMKLVPIWIRLPLLTNSVKNELPPEIKLA